MCAGSSRRASNPAVDARVQRLDPAVEDFREGVTSLTAVTGTPAGSSAASVPPVETIS